VDRWQAITLAGLHVVTIAAVFIAVCAGAEFAPLSVSIGAGILVFAAGRQADRSAVV